MTKKTRNKTLASIVAAVYILATMTACSSEASSSNLPSETGTTSYTDNGSSAPETTTTAETTTPAPETTTTTAETTTPPPETTTTTAETTTPPPETTTTTAETTTPAPETTTTMAETTTLAPETTTQTTTSKPQTEVPAPEEVVEKLNKKMYAIGAVCSYEKNTIRFSEPVNKYHMNDEVVVVEKVAGMYNGKGCDEGYFYKLDDGYYVPAGMFTDNKNWQAETTFQTYDWNPDNLAIPDLPPSDQFIGDLFD